MITPVAVGVDLGSNSARALALDPDGRVLGSARGPYRGVNSWPDGRAEPEGWLEGVIRALDVLAGEVPGARRPAALSIGGQSPTTVPDGGGLAVTCRHPAGVTGTPQEQHLAQAELLRTERGPDLVPVQVYDWLSARLGAGPAQSRWPGDPELLGYGPVAATGACVGVTDGSHGLPSGISLIAGAQDAYLAIWAAGVDTPGRALDPGGRTGGLAVAVTAGAGNAGMYALRSAAAGVDVVGGPVSGHGLMLEWLRTLTGRPMTELLAAAAAVPPGAGDVLVLPYLEGERAPRWNRELRGEIVGLNASSGPGEITRAALEGAAYGLAHIAAELRTQGAGLDVLVCAGAPARSPLWCAIKAAVLEVPVEVPAETDLAAYGAALAAGAGAGWWPPPGTGSCGDWPRPAVTVVHPEPDPVYRRAYRRFVALGDAAELRQLEETHAQPDDLR
jgi:xylulokinase